MDFKLKDKVLFYYHVDAKDNLCHPDNILLGSIQYSGTIVGIDWVCKDSISNILLGFMKAEPFPYGSVAGAFGQSLWEQTGIDYIIGVKSLFSTYRWVYSKNLLPFSSGNNLLSPSGAINNHICPTCKETRVSKPPIETSCWRCGNKL